MSKLSKGTFKAERLNSKGAGFHVYKEPVKEIALSRTEIEVKASAHTGKDLVMISKGIIEDSLNVEPKERSYVLQLAKDFLRDRDKKMDRKVKELQNQYKK